MKQNEYMNKIIDILYRETMAFDLNLFFNKIDRDKENYVNNEPNHRGKYVGTQKLHLIPYLGKKGNKQDTEKCEQIIKKVNAVIWQYKLDMWDQLIKDGVSFDEMTGADLPSKEELAEQGNIDFIDTKGNA
tara:strand:+ start:688 stop:1080 length:393 start_codon:yes stop_codon:yes gene_type:complete